MQMSLKRCKHFELGGEKKTKGAALTFVCLHHALFCLLELIWLYAFSKRSVYFSTISSHCMSLLLYYCPFRLVHLVRCWKLAMHMNIKNYYALYPTDRTERGCDLIVFLCSLTPTNDHSWEGFINSR